MGNTCFINACMQVLSHTYELNDFLDLKIYKKRLNNKHDSILLLEWDSLRELLWNENCVVEPGRFINCIQKIAKIKGATLFTGFSQNDLQARREFQDPRSQGIFLVFGPDSISANCFFMQSNSF